MKKRTSENCIHTNNSWFGKPSLSEQDRRVLLQRIAGQMGLTAEEALPYAAPLFTRN